MGLRENGLECPLAENRLLKTGVAGTVLYGTSAEEKSLAVAAVEAQNKFNELDATLSMNMTKVIELSPLLQELQGKLNKIPGVPPDLLGFETLKTWLCKMHTMRAGDSLGEEQVQQLTFDLQ